MRVFPFVETLIFPSVESAQCGLNDSRILRIEAITGGFELGSSNPTVLPRRMGRSASPLIGKTRNDYSAPTHENQHDGDFVPHFRLFLPTLWAQSLAMSL